MQSKVLNDSVASNYQQNLKKDELQLLEHSIEEQQQKKSQLASDLSVVKQPNLELETQINEAETTLKSINNEILNIENQIRHERDRKTQLEKIRSETQMSVEEVEKKRNQMNDEMERFRESIKQEEEQNRKYLEQVSETQQNLMERMNVITHNIFTFRLQF